MIESYKAEIQRLTDENAELRQKNQEHLTRGADQNQLNIMQELEQERNSLTILKKKIDQDGASLILQAKKEIEDLKSNTEIESKASNDNEKHELQATKDKVSSMITKNGIKVTVFIKTSNRYHQRINIRFLMKLSLSLLLGQTHV